jgi:Fe-S-cluster containining protein
MARIRSSEKKKFEVGIGNYTTAILVKPEDTFRFDCLRCGDCCSHPPSLIPKESHAIAKYLGMSNKEFFDKYVVLQENAYCGWLAALSTVGDECVFYSKDKGKASCKIQNVKPNLCRSKPVMRYASDYNPSLETMQILYEPCRGYGRGEEQTVANWIAKKGLRASWQDDYEYYTSLENMTEAMPLAEIEKKVREMFVS